MLYNRKSIRLKEYDYSQEGAYYFTICTQNRDCLFGDVIDGNMVLNEAGKEIETVWNELDSRFLNIETDTYIIMPNHIHGIIFIVGAPLVGAQNKEETWAGTRPAPTIPFGDIIGAFKSITTHRYICGIKQKGWIPFNGTLWQRNYWEHIIRDERELNRSREYIINNPLQWKSDNENPNSRE